MMIARTAVAASPHRAARLRGIFPQLPGYPGHASLQGKVTAAVGSYEQTLKSMQELASKLPPDLAADMQLKIEQVRSNMLQELEMSRLAEAALQPAASAHRS